MERAQGDQQGDPESSLWAAQHRWGGTPELTPAMAERHPNSQSTRWSPQQWGQVRPTLKAGLNPLKKAEKQASKGSNCSQVYKQHPPKSLETVERTPNNVKFMSGIQSKLTIYTRKLKNKTQKSQKLLPYEEKKQSIKTDPEMTDDRISKQGH